MSVLAFWDDLYGLSPLTRFLFQFFTAILFLWAWVGLFPQIPLGGVTLSQVLLVLALANLFVAAASMGFLVHNWPPARVFMGDAGSAFLGGFFGIQSVIAAIATPIPFPVLVLPFSNFILDTSFTLIRRMWRGGGEELVPERHTDQKKRKSGWGSTT